MTENVIKWIPDQEDEDHNCLCIWPGTIVEDGDEEDLQRVLQQQLGNEHPVKIVGTVFTLPTPGEPDTGGRADFCFYFHNSDIPRVAVGRLVMGIRWWQDIFFNKSQAIYPNDFIAAYPCEVEEWRD